MQLLPIDREGQITWVGSPHSVLTDVLVATRDLYARKGFDPPWIGYVAIQDGAVVGTCGFAAPAQDGEAEIAYFTFPEHEGRGFASRMAAALIGLCEPAAATDQVQFVAHTLPEEGPSCSILRKLGFDCLGAVEHAEDGVVWKWRRWATPSTSVVAG